MKWIHESCMSEALTKPLDLNMIPQSYRHLIANPHAQSIGIPSRNRNASQVIKPEVSEEDSSATARQSMLTVKSLQDSLKTALSEDLFDDDEEVDIEEY